MIRIYLIKNLVNVGLKFKRGLEVLMSWRGKFWYGLWWWLRISKSNIEKLNGWWRKGVRNLANIHQTSPIQDFMKTFAIPELHQTVIGLIVEREIKKPDNQSNSHLFQRTSIINQQQPTHKYNLRKKPETEDLNLDFDLKREVQDLKKKVLFELDNSKKKKKVFSIKYLINSHFIGSKSLRGNDSLVKEIAKKANEKNSYLKKINEKN